MNSNKKNMTEEELLLRQEIDSLSFEEALQKLEEIVEEMESGNSPLEKMISSFEKGSVLASACQAKLDALRTKIEILRKDRQSGNYKWTPLQEMEQEDEDLSEETAAPSGPNHTASPGNNEDVPF